VNSCALACSGFTAWVPARARCARLAGMTVVGRAITGDVRSNLFNHLAGAFPVFTGNLQGRGQIPEQNQGPRLRKSAITGAGLSARSDHPRRVFHGCFTLPRSRLAMFHGVFHGTIRSSHRTRRFTSHGPERADHGREIVASDLRDHARAKRQRPARRSRPGASLHGRHITLCERSCQEGNASSGLAFTRECRF
jgi:hypothetical protein